MTIGMDVRRRPPDGPRRDQGEKRMADLLERADSRMLRAAGPGSTAREPMVLRLAIADPRRLIAETLALAVREESTFEVVATVWGDISPLAIAESGPDMILIGVGSEEERALTLIEALAHRLPSAEMVIVADAPTRRLLQAVVERSLGGLLLTDHPATDLVASLAHIARGQAVLPCGWQAVLARPSSEPLDCLSERQLEVLRLLAEGCSYEEIGSRLFISLNTVKFHTRSIFERLGVHNRMAAVRLLGSGR
jgi:two-component system, NarL family, nitrate/nitrite response regulator NarP